MYKKLLLSALIILGIIASTQAQSFDFVCEEEGVTSFVDGTSSLDLEAQTFVVNGDVWKSRSSSTNQFNPQVAWEDFVISLTVIDDVFYLSAQKGTNNFSDRVEEFTDFSELINRIEDFRTFSYRGVNFNNFNQTLSVDGVEFISTGSDGSILRAPSGWTAAPYTATSFVYRSNNENYAIASNDPNDPNDFITAISTIENTYTSAVDKLLSYSEAFPNFHYSGSSYLDHDQRMFYVDGFRFLSISPTSDAYLSVYNYSIDDIRVTIIGRNFVIAQNGGISLSTPDFAKAIVEIKRLRN